MAWQCRELGNRQPWYRFSLPRIFRFQHERGCPIWTWKVSVILKKSFSKNCLSSVSIGIALPCVSMIMLMINRGNSFLWDGCQYSIISCQHWFSLWLGAIRQQAITWVNVHPVLFVGCHQGPLLLYGLTLIPAWISNCMLSKSIPKLQRCNLWCLGMDKWFSSHTL